MVADRWMTDWEINPKYPLFTRANAGEVLPDPCSPLGWTLVWMPPGLLAGWRDSGVLDYGSSDPDELSESHPEVVGLFGGYLYINGTAVRLFGVRGPGLTPGAIDAVYFGDHPDKPPYVPEPWHENEAATARLGVWMGGVVSATDLPELRLDRTLVAAQRAGRPDLGALTDPQLIERARSMVPLLRHLFRRHLTVTAGSSIGAGIVSGIAAAVGEAALALTLITSVGDVDSAAPSLAMWQLSRLQPDSPKFAAGLQSFLYEFGCRGPNEWDIRSPVWETDPKLATVLIDSMRSSPTGEAPSVRNQRNVLLRQAATEKVRAAISDKPEVVAQFEAGLQSAHVYLAGRERTKTNVIRVLHEVRVAIRELATRHDYTMSEVCMLLADELDAFCAEPSEFRPRLTQREHEYLELFDLEPPFIIDGHVDTLDRWKHKGEHAFEIATPGTVLHGVPGSPGIARGRARIILHPSDPGALEPGDVLVAPITDPAWTPLFVPAAAVVVNVGAQVSHAVIVSRELGIPCVASVQYATDRIPDGALVEVDGSAGTVTVL